MKGKQFKTWKIDEIAYNFIRKHQGEQNKVTGAEVLAEVRSHGYDLTNIRQVIDRIMRERHAPICSAGRGGYWWAASRADIEIAIADAEAREKAFRARAKFFRSFLFD